MPILSCKNKRRGCVTFRGKEYEPNYINPHLMVIDDTISWEAKGYLSHYLFATYEDELHIPIKIAKELINSVYLVEVQS